MSKPKKEAVAAPEGGEGASDAKKKPPVLLIAVAAGALAVGGGGAAAAFMLMGGHGAPAEGEAKPHKAKPKKKEGGEKGKEGKSPISEGPDGVVYYTMPDITANMQTGEGRPGFIKLKLAFELPDEAAAEEIEPNAPRLNDMFQTFLRELRPEDLAGSAGSYQLRMELLRRTNLVIAPAKVKAVLIEEMLVN